MASSSAVPLCTPVLLNMGVSAIACLCVQAIEQSQSGLTAKVQAAEGVLRVVREQLIAQFPRSHRKQLLDMLDARTSLRSQIQEAQVRANVLLANKAEAERAVTGLKRQKQKFDSEAKKLSDCEYAVDAAETASQERQVCCQHIIHESATGDKAADDIHIPLHRPSCLTCRMVCRQLCVMQQQSLLMSHLK
jgi:hypothetical protein